MDEKTEQLRDIFTSVTDEESVTESQDDTRGSLERDERSIDERLEGVVGRMRERYGFEVGLGTEELVAVAKRFYADESDDAIADALGVDTEEVFEGRLALHLVDEGDADGVDLTALREADDATLAAEHGVDVDRIRRYRRIAAARERSRAANDRYREEFDDLLGDTGLTTRMARDVREDGLEDATEGMETDVSF